MVRRPVHVSVLGVLAVLPLLVVGVVALVCALGQAWYESL